MSYFLLAAAVDFDLGSQIGQWLVHVAVVAVVVVVCVTVLLPVLGKLRRVVRNRRPVEYDAERPGPPRFNG